MNLKVFLMFIIDNTEGHDKRTYADSENGERGLVQTSQIHHDYGYGGKMYEKVSI